MAINALTDAGLTVQGTPDIITELTAGYTSIYGADINLESNTPDGQMMNIYATALEDNLQLLVMVYNGFSIANAVGVQVDNLVALNGMQRQAGTYTIAQVNVTAAQAVSLAGQDVLVSNPNATVFTVSDNSGNQFQLQTSYAFSGAGTVTLAFVAVNIGQTLTSANTITNIFTPLTGITAVNNPSTSSDIIGVNEESDVALKIRQGQSFQAAATGPADALRAQLLNTQGVVDAFVAENDSSSIVNGVAANGIWTIVNAPTTLAAQIAQIIYSKKTAGCAQTGAVTYNVTRPAGNIFVAQWDYAVQESLYISFEILPINGVDTFNTTTLAASLAAALIYKLNQSAFVGDVIRAMQIIAPNGYLQNVFVGSSASPTTQTATPANYKSYFFVAAANITITT